MSESSKRASLEERMIKVVGAEHLTSEEPHFHVRPGSAAEISTLAEIALELDLTLIAVGKGRRSTPTDDMRTQLFIDMGRMKHVLHLDETSLMVHVQTGRTGLELEATLNKRGLTLGDFPPASLNSSIGGLLSVRTPGKSTRRHGTLEDTVLGLSAILAGGRQLHTRVGPRRATGPDLNRILCGSEGALGIITSAHLRIYRLPESRLLAAYRVPTFADALTAVRLALREEASPAALRIYDCQEAEVHLGKVCEGDEAILVAATVGPTSLATCDRDLISSAVGVVGGEPADQSIADTWWQRRTGNDEGKDAPPSPNLQVSATPRKLAPVYEAICASAAKSNFRVRAHSSRFARDGGVLFFTISTEDGTLLSPKATEMESIKKDAESAGAYLLESTNASLRGYFEDLRNALDPGRHLNPGVLR